jgi:hypothetical protein
MEKICMIFFNFFINFVSSCAQYVHDELMFTWCIPPYDDLARNSWLSEQDRSKLGKCAKAVANLINQS